MNAANKKWKIAQSRIWKYDGIVLGHASSVFDTKDQLQTAQSDNEKVRLHMGLRGDYSFTCKQVPGTWDLIGGHHNLMYTNGLDLEIQNKSIEIETLGISIDKAKFIEMAGGSSKLIKLFIEDISAGKNALASTTWGTIQSRIQRTVNEMLHNPYQDRMEEIFLYGKTLELLILCIDNYESKFKSSYIYLKSTFDKEAIVRARDFVRENVTSPPSLSEVAREVGINEYKLKYGFKEMFGIPIFNYLQNERLNLATQMLRDSTLQISNIATELGYASPQHFSNIYKKKMGTSPSKVRKGQILSL